MGTAAGGWAVFGGDAGGGFSAEADVVSKAGQVLVTGFGLQFGRGASGLGQVLQRRMAQLVQCPACAVGVDMGGGGLEQVLGTGVGQPGPAGGGQTSAAAGDRRPEAGARRSDRCTGPQVRPLSRRGSRRAGPVAQCTYSIAPPLETTRARRNSVSRSAMSRDRISSTRAAVSCSICRSTRSRRALRSLPNRACRRAWGDAAVASAQGCASL